MDRDASYAGYTLAARLPAASAAVERWRARGPDGTAEVFIGPEALARRARTVPAWGPFPRIVTGTERGRWFVVVPGSIELDLEALAARLPGGACVAFAWHLTAALAEVHEHGGAHGALHPAWCGLDSRGHLVVRPALAAAVKSEPDPDASAQATDCLQLATLFDTLAIDRADEPAIELLLAGLARDRSRLRMQPGRAARQTLAALLKRHPLWEERLVEDLGASWAIGALPRAPMAARAAPPAHPWNTAAVAAVTPQGAPIRPATAPATINLGAAGAGRSVGGIGDRTARPAAQVAPALAAPAAIQVAASAPVAAAVAAPLTPAPRADAGTPDAPEVSGIQVRLGRPSTQAAARIAAALPQADPPPTALPPAVEPAAAVAASAAIAVAGAEDSPPPPAADAASQEAPPPAEAIAAAEDDGAEDSPPPPAADAASQEAPPPVEAIAAAEDDGPIGDVHESDAPAQDALDQDHAPGSAQRAEEDADEERSVGVASVVLPPTQVAVTEEDFLDALAESPDGAPDGASGGPELDPESTHGETADEPEHGDDDALGEDADLNRDDDDALGEDADLDHDDDALGEDADLDHDDDALGEDADLDHDDDALGEDADLDHDDDALGEDAELDHDDDALGEDALGEDADRAPDDDDALSQDGHSGDRGDGHPPDDDDEAGGDHPLGDESALAPETDAEAPADPADGEPPGPAVAPSEWDDDENTQVTANPLVESAAALAPEVAGGEDAADADSDPPTTPDDGGFFADPSGAGGLHVPGLGAAVAADPSALFTTPSIAPEADPAWAPSPASAPAPSPEDAAARSDRLARTSPRPSSTPPVPESSPAPTAARVAIGDGDDSPRWASAGGVTGDENREKELGSGKWAEEAEMGLDEVRRQMDDKPVRDVDFEPAGANWTALIAAAVLIALLGGWGIWAATSGSSSDAPTAEAPALPQTVTVRAEGGDATITFDGRDLGPAPAQVPIPPDAQPHQLCAQPAQGEPVCQEVTAAKMVANPSFTLSVR